MENVEVIKTTVGNIIEKYSEKAKNDLNVTTVYTVSNEFGLLPSIDYWKKKGSKNKKSYKMFSNDTSNYNIVRKNMFAYNPSCLNIGSIDCLLNKEAGLVSPMYKIFKIKENIILPKYLLHFLKSKAIINKIDSLKEKGARNRFDFEKWEKIEINIPPLKKQEEIATVLDKFTGMTEELTQKLIEELTVRETQYDYYRNMLLSEEYLNKIIKKNQTLQKTTLGKIGKFIRGNGLQKKDFVEKGNPVIHYGQLYTYYGFSSKTTISFTDEKTFLKLKKAKQGDILMATTSENIEDVGKATVWLGDEEIGFSGDMYSYRTSENPKYIAYYFQTENFQVQKEKKVTGTKIIRIHADDMECFEIILPPIEIQNEIVDILDSFETLVNNIRQGLPREIELRQKQYEYYREKLLTFE